MTEWRVNGILIKSSSAYGRKTKKSDDAGGLFLKRLARKKPDR